MATKRVEISETGQRRRVQITVGGEVLAYLEERGHSSRTRPEEWAVRGLWAVLDEYLDAEGGDFRRWQEVMVEQERTLRS